MLKYKIYVFILFLIFILGINIVSAKKEANLLGKVIYLDAGHGGKDPGAIYKNILEKDINLSISLLLQKELEKEGAIVYQTRTDDYDLSLPNVSNRKRNDLLNRSKIINKSNCDLFISLHLNAEQSEIWSGPQVFYDDNNSKNKNIAQLIQKELNKSLKSDRKIKLKNDLYLQSRINRPGVLVEVGFLSNPNDRYLLQKKSYQKKVSVIITKSIIKIFN